MHYENQIEEYCKSAKAGGKKIGLANGCFDCLHEGHLHLLRESRKHCDILVVAVNTDESVRKLKGKNRPVDIKAIRYKKLLDTKLVDIITSFDDERELLAFVKEVRPDVMIKGADYHGMSITGAGYVQNCGGKIVLIPLLDGFSTTKSIAGN